MYLVILMLLLPVLKHLQPQSCLYCKELCFKASENKQTNRKENSIEPNYLKWLFVKNVAITIVKISNTTIANQAGNSFCSNRRTKAQTYKYLPRAGMFHKANV